MAMPLQCHCHCTSCRPQLPDATPILYMLWTYLHLSSHEHLSVVVFHCLRSIFWQGELNNPGPLQHGQDVNWNQGLMHTNEALHGWHPHHVAFMTAATNEKGLPYRADLAEGLFKLALMHVKADALDIDRPAIILHVVGDACATTPEAVSLGSILRQGCSRSEKQPGLTKLRNCKFEICLSCNDRNETLCQLSALNKFSSGGSSAWKRRRRRGTFS